MLNTIKNRYEFVLLFDVENGNPNGDPDAGNMPRIDPETGYGIVTDVCIKRKIRNYVEIVKGGNPPFDIYVRENEILNAQHRKAYAAEGIIPNEKDKKLPDDPIKAKAVTDFMCHNFFDIRTFGAVMTTRVNCGQVRGPVQLNFARSADPIIQQEVTITRVAVTTEEDAKKKEHEMGRKHIVPYGLYRTEGYISAFFAQKTGFNEDDLKLLWEALTNMFEHDHSAAHGKMSTRKLIVFEHDSYLGNFPANKLFDLVKIKHMNESLPARSFSDYGVVLNRNAVPQGVKIIEML